ncbi:MAG TPA: thioredoxin-disulfide reductase [Conexibacter sp.]
MTDVEDVIIIGSGPAGYTAALYTARANLSPLVIEGFAWGGLLQQTTDVENFPGYPRGIMGPEMMQDLRDQAERFGTRFITDDATRVELTDGGGQTVWIGDEAHRAKAVVLATGAQHKKLGVPGEEELSGRGVSYCATCDAAFFKEHDTVIVGGGDSAMEEAIFLAKFAARVHVLNRRDEFRASPIMLDRARAVENIEFLTPYVPEAFVAGENGALSFVRARHAETGELRDVPATGAFVAIGHVPQSELFAGQVELDENGYVKTAGQTTRTALAGVFAAGDLVDHTYRQAITAAGSGCKAALDAEWYLRDTPPDVAARGASQQTIEA